MQNCTIRLPPSVYSSSMPISDDQPMQQHAVHIINSVLSYSMVYISGNPFKLVYANKTVQCSLLACMSAICSGEKLYHAYYGIVKLCYLLENGSVFEASL